MSQTDKVSADRGTMADLNRQSSSMRVIGLAMILLVAGYLAWHFLMQRDRNKIVDDTKNARISTPEIRGLDLDPIPTPPPPTPEPEIVTLGQIRQELPVLDTSVLDRKLGGFNNVRNNTSIDNDTYGGEVTAGGTDFTVTPETAGTNSNTDTIDDSSRVQNYDGQGVAKVIASRIGNRSLILTQGAKIACTLETAIDSSLPGMTSCIVSQDVYSSDGKVRLIDRGSKLNGRYNSDMRIGEIRLAIIWERLETPEGVLVDLSSNGTDPLGRSGASGWVDTHFWERFGHAIMFSLISDGFQYLNNLQSRNNNPRYFADTEDATEDMAKTALDTEINLAPTLHKNQGDPIMVLLNKDLSFEDVYELELGSQRTNQFKEEYFGYQRK